MGELTDFDDWIDTLTVEVVQDEYGYEPGEFTVYPQLWRPLWREGLSPSAAFKRACDAWNREREDQEAARLANYERIKAADAALIAQHQGEEHER